MANGETQERTTPGVQNIERRNNIVALIERELKARGADFTSRPVQKRLSNPTGTSGWIDAPKGDNVKSQVFNLTKDLLSEYADATDAALAALAVEAMFLEGKTPSMNEISRTLGPDLSLSDWYDTFTRNRQGFDAEALNIGEQEATTTTAPTTTTTASTTTTAPTTTTTAPTAPTTAPTTTQTQTADVDGQLVPDLRDTITKFVELYEEVSPREFQTKRDGTLLLGLDGQPVPVPGTGPDIGVILELASAENIGQLNRSFQAKLQELGAIDAFDLQKLRGEQLSSEAYANRLYETARDASDRRHDLDILDQSQRFTGTQSELARLQQTIQNALDRGLTREISAEDRALVRGEGALDRDLTRDLSDDQINATAEQINQKHLNTLAQDAQRNVYNATQNAADRSLVQQEINNNFAQVNAELARTDAKLAFDNDKFAVETALGRDRQALQTETAIESAMAERRGLTFQYGQLQQDLRQFNANSRIAVDMENARRKELQQARRAQLAADIGQLAQDAGSRGRLATVLLANPNLGLLSETLAGGQDFFTEESLAPLSDLLRQREDASQDPNLLTYDDVPEIATPDMGAPSFSAPTSYADLMNMMGDPTAGLGPMTQSSLTPTMSAAESAAIRQAIEDRNKADKEARDQAKDDEKKRQQKQRQKQFDAGLNLPAAADLAVGTYYPHLGRYWTAADAAAANQQPTTTAPTTQTTGTMDPAVVDAMNKMNAILDQQDAENKMKDIKKKARKTVGSEPGAEDPYTSVMPSMAGGGLFRPRKYAGGGLAESAYIGDEKGPELHIPLGPGEALVIPHDKVESFLKSASRAGALGDADVLPEMAGGGKVKSQRQVNFLLSKNSPLTAKEKARLKKELKTGDVKIPRMEKGGKFPEDSVAGDLVGMGISAMADGGMFDQGTIFGTAKPADQTQTRNFLQQALRRALTGTPWQGRGRAPTPVEVSAPGTDPMVRELAASLSALGTGTPQDVFLRRAAALSPRGIAERAGGVRRTA